jgi:serine/threonine protein kinase
MAPPFRPLLDGQAVGMVKPVDLVEAGQRLGDFELVQLLGKGSFAKVFPARQVSLDRQVALNVSANQGSEARTLARLEHDHIVQVFSETIERDLRLLCMQYVAGTTLQLLIRTLAARATWEGADLLEVVNRFKKDAVALDPAAVRDCEYLHSCDRVQAVCWVGTRLAQALACAHSQGVLHRDLKPANILVNHYGRPLLADFNLALNAPRQSQDGAMFGGTLAYMAPEHLDAFNPQDPTPPEAVDQRSDIYSLGVVLYELLTGGVPFGKAASGPAVRDVRNTGRDRASLLRELAQERRRRIPSPRQAAAFVSEPLDRAVRRCLDPEPARRYQTAAALAQALEGCRRHRHCENELPPPGPVTRVLLRFPFLMGFVLMLLPHLLATVVNITYNQINIVGHLTPAQQTLFPRLVLAYNLVVYAICLTLLCRLIIPVVRTWRQLAGAEIPDDARVAAARRQALSWPRWIIGLSCLGWLPGVLVFPLGLHWLAGPADPDVFGHFFISNTLAGLIAMTYSFFATQYLVLRVLYPRLWVDAQRLRELTRDEELGALDRRLGSFQLCAGLIPLTGAAVLVTVGPDHLTLAFRLLVLGLLALGTAGFALAILVSGLLRQTLTALRGGKGVRPGRRDSQSGSQRKQSS